MAKTRGKAAATPISKKKENPILESQQMILIKQLESLLNALNANKSDGIDTQTGVDSSIENLILSRSEVQLFIKDVEKVVEGSFSPAPQSTRTDSRSAAKVDSKCTNLPTLSTESQHRIVELLYQWIGGKISSVRSNPNRAGSPLSKQQNRLGKYDGKIDEGFENNRLLLLTLFNLIDSTLDKNQEIRDSFETLQTRFSLDSIFYSLENDAMLKECIPQILSAGTSTGIPPPPVKVDEEVDGDASHDEKGGLGDRIDLNQMNSEMSQQMDMNGTMILNHDISVLTELDPNQSINSAPSGLKYLYSMIGKNLANPAQMKSIKQIVNDVIPSKSKWARDGRQGQEKMLAQMEKVLSDLRNYIAHSFPFLKPVQKREAPNYHDIIKYPMDLSTVLKKLKAFQYFDKQDFAKDLDLIWENCLTYNTSSDSPYRVHALKMRERCHEALRRVIEVEEEDEGAEEEEEIEEIVVKEEVGSASGVGSFKAPGIASGGRSKDDDQMMDVVSDVESNVATGPAASTLAATIETVDEVIAENNIDYSIDECFLTHQWKLATNLYRAKMLKTRQELATIPFSERPAFLLKQDDLDVYVANEARSAIRNQRFSLSVISKPTLSDSDNDPQDYDSDQEEDDAKKEEEKEKQAGELAKVESSFFLPELYPISIPVSHIPATIPAYLRDFFVYEDSPPNPVPIPPLPSLSEYPQIHPDMKSPLNYHLMNNVTEFKRLKQMYHKIVAKQSGEDPSTTIIRNVPTLRGGPFQRNYTIDQLPEFKVDEVTCHASLQRVVSLLISHQGFDSIHQSALSTVTEIMSHIMISSARLLKTFRDEMGKENSEFELVIKVLREMGFDDVDCLQMYIERDVIRQGRKLNDLRTKLESAWINSGKEESDSFSLERTSNQEKKMDVDVEQHADDIMNGTFLEDLGLDFLNVKELGLDIKIPSELWNRKNEIRANARIRRVASHSVDIDSARENVPVYNAPQSWGPVDPSSQIGLLSALFRRLQSVPDGMIEDDQKSKTKEAKLLIKYALAGGRKIVSVPKKKADGATKAKSKKERKKKKKDLATAVASTAVPSTVGTPTSAT